jgi:hypothetical protein
MKKIINMVFVLTVLTGAGSQLYAENFSLNDLPVIARKIVTLPGSSSAQSISVPRSTLTYRDAVPGVFVLENDEARFRMVRTGKLGATRIEILSGLFGNEVLLLGDLDQVHDGSPVRVIK